MIRFRTMWISVPLVSALLFLAILIPSKMEGQTTADPAPSAAGSTQANESDPAQDSSQGQQVNQQPAHQPKEAEPQQALPESPESQQERAERELREQEHQRFLGVIPNFNTTNNPNAAPLTPKQKFQLAFRSGVDPFQFVFAGLDAGLGQAENSFAGYGQGAQGYAKRFGAAYADQASSLFWGNAFLPVVLHEDPRYFRKGSGGFRRRFLYAMGTAFRTKKDDGSWGFNYSNVLGNVAAGGLSNLYYPSTDRGVELTFERAFTVTAEGMIGAEFIEFGPDIMKRVFHKKPKQVPPAEAAPIELK